MVSIKLFLHKKHEEVGSIIPESIMKPTKKITVLKRLVILVVILYLIFYKFSFLLLQSINKVHKTSIIFPTNSSITPTEVLEVTLPHPDFGEPVYNQHLLSHVFANSWGKPAIVEYTAPPLDIAFNKVILTLNTSVNGVQYDRLAHLYLDGILLWRTSTIEPGGKPVYSTASKDVSIYAKLFTQDNIPLMLQLDNLMTKRLTGAFNISLEATYYNAPENVSIVPKDFDDELSSPGSVKHFFGNSDPADQIWSMVDAAPNRPPLIYQPSNALESRLPKFNSNTTRAKIELFMSGNAAEEFWYSNVLDDNKDSFNKHNHPLLGHGPCRVANIFLNDLKIATLAPEPTIYTGGISPALWRPIVASGAFDVRALEIELTPVLPLLWGSSSNDLKIEIGNCIDDSLKRGKPSFIGQNWITTANILTWESDQVESSYGELVVNFNDTSSHIVEIGGGGYSSTLMQIVSSNYKTYIQGTLNYNLTNGSTINVLSDAVTSLDFSNIQTYTNYGDKQQLVSTSTSHHSFSLSDLVTDDLISGTNITHNFPLIVSIATKPIGRDVAYDVSLVRGSHANVKFSNSSEPSIVLKSLQNGTSSYYLSPNGNHGTGNTEHKFKALTRHPLPELLYKRHVLALDGEVVKDKQKWFKHSDDVDVEHGEDEAIRSSNINFEIRNQDHLTIYNGILSHLENLVDDELLDPTSFDYMVSQLTHSLNDDIGIGSIQNNWGRVDPKMLKQVGLFHNLI